MSELLIDFITSLDGYGAAEGWPGWWGLQGPEYLAWLAEPPEAGHTILMGANTYRLMSSSRPKASRAPMRSRACRRSSSRRRLSEPLAWANTRLVSGNAVEVVRAMKDEDGGSPMRTLGSLTLCRSLLYGRSRGPLPRGRLSGHHREQRSRPDLRRVPRRRTRPDRAAASSTAASNCSSTPAGPDRSAWRRRSQRVRGASPLADAIFRRASTGGDPAACRSIIAGPGLRQSSRTCGVSQHERSGSLGSQR